MGKYEELLAKAKGLPPVPTSVAHPCEATALAGAIDAAAKGLLIPPRTTGMEVYSGAAVEGRQPVREIGFK